MENILEQNLLKFRLHRSLVSDLLDKVDEKALVEQPIRNAGSFGKQFRHIADIQRCYSDALISGALNFVRSDINHGMETDKSLLSRHLSDSASEFVDAIKQIDSGRAEEKYIDCAKVVKYIGSDHVNASPAELSWWAVEHEILHEGELTLYARASEVEFPKSWFTWGLL